MTRSASAAQAEISDQKTVRLEDFEPSGEIRVFNLDDEIVPKDIAEHIQLGEHNLRRGIADRIIRFFIIINGATLSTFLVLFLFDVWLIKSGNEKPTERLIDGSVIKILIGATTVQLGAAVALTMKYLFPSATKDK